MAETTPPSWYDIQSARRVWKDADSIPDDLLGQYLDAAREQCIGYAPAMAEGATLPARYVLAQLMQARALYQAQKAAPGDVIGGDGFTVRVYPMDWQIKALLRPPRATPGVG